MIRNVHLLYVHYFLSDLRFHGAFLVIYFAEITGSYVTAMSVLALETIASAVMEIPTGIFSDKIGRKYTITLGSLAAALTVICYAFAETSALLFAGALFSGISMSLFSGNNDALLFESLKADNKEDRFHHYQGRAHCMFQLALGLSALSTVVLTGYGLRYIFMLGIAPQILSILISLLLREPPVEKGAEQHSWSHLKTACREIANNPRLLLLMIGQAITHGANESNFNFKSAYVNTLWPLWAIGLYRALSHGLSFIGFWFAGRIVDKIKAPQMLALREIYWFVSQSVGVMISNVATPILFISGSLFFGPGLVARDHLLQKEFTDKQRATMGSLASFMGSLVFAAVALSIGLISDRYGLAAGVSFGIVMSVTSLPIYIKLFSKYF